MKRIVIIGPIILIFAVVLLLMFTACNTQTQTIPPPQPLQARLDSLEQRLRHAYTPGFGELMLNIQVHHAKLWFAGKNGNWQLAAYDESLIRSAFQKIRAFHPDNPNTAITSKDPVAFRRSFTYLTTTCNNCHAVTKHAFNVITIPNSEPIGNQDYSPNFTKTN